MTDDLLRRARDLLAAGILTYFDSGQDHERWQLVADIEALSPPIAAAPADRTRTVCPTPGCSLLPMHGGAHWPESTPAAQIAGEEGQPQQLGSGGPTTSTTAAPVAVQMPPDAQAVGPAAGEPSSPAPIVGPSRNTDDGSANGRPGPRPLAYLRQALRAGVS